MQKVLTVFPKRRISIRNPGHVSTSASLSVAIVSALAAVVVALMLLPNILYDYHIDSDWEPETEASAEARCSGNVFWSCDIQILSTGGRSKSSHFIYLGSSPLSKLIVIRNKHNSILLTSNWNIEMLWQRIFFASVVLGFPTLLSLGMLNNWRNSRKAWRLKERGRSVSMIPVVVSVKRHTPWWQVGESEANWWHFSGKMNRIRINGSTEFGPGKLPFLLQDAETALAVGLPDSAGFILLDNELLRLALTDAEREAIVIARGVEWEIT